MRKSLTTAAVAALVLLIFTVVCGPYSAAQSGKTPPTTTTTTTTQSPRPPSGPDFLRNLIVTGNVVMADGSPPPQPVAIEAACPSRTERVAHTDAKGFFSFQPWQQLPLMQDASESSFIVTPGRGITGPNVFAPQPTVSSDPLSMLRGCEFRGYLAGFRSTSVALLGMDQQNPVNIGTIVLLGAEKQSATVSATDLKAPPNARKEYQKASAYLRRRDFSHAQRELEQAVKLYPQYAAAWAELGRLHKQQNRLDQAHQAFVQARGADDRFVPAYIGLASVAVRESKWAEAQEVSSRATELNGAEFPMGFYYNAVANYQLGQWDKAEKSARAGSRFDTRLLPQMKLLLGYILSMKRDYVAAAEELKGFLKLVPTAANAAQVRQHIAELEKLATSPPQPSVSQKIPAATAVASETKLDLAFSTNWGPIDTVAATSDPAGQGPSRKWAPPDIDEAIPPVSPGVPCPLNQVVSGVSSRAKQLMDNLQQFGATERIQHINVDKNGNAGRPASATAKYVASIQAIANGGLEVHEYRDGAVSDQTFPANLATTGIAAHALVFHPALIDDIAITCEGLGNVRGQPAWQLHFAQRPDRPARFRLFLTNRGSFAASLKGRVWASADNYQVMRMETDLVKPIEEIALRKDHIAIDYVGVEFRKRNVQLWLPQTADLYLDFLGRRAHRQHSFGDFELFWVETTEKTKGPELR